MTEPFDPKTEVTEHAFVIPSHILGKPLASPTKRLIAFLLDLLLVAILSGLGFYTLSGLLAVLAYRRVRNREKEGTFKKFGDRIWAASAALAIFILSFSVLSIFDKEDGKSGLKTDVFINNDGVKKSLSPEELNELKSLVDFDNDSLKNIDLNEIIGRAVSIVENLEKPIAKADYRLSSNELEKLSEFLNYAAKEAETESYDSLRVLASQTLSKPEISAYKKKVSKLNARLSDLEDENEGLLDKVDNPSFISMIIALANDFGFAFGWGGLYFVFSVAWFNGQTLAKKLLKLRVVKLNGKPLGIWYSFERFGGYAAGIATGLLGFMQIMWDPNRQAVHDKISGTVVVDESFENIK